MEENKTMENKIQDIHNLLKDLTSTKYPDLPTPPGCKKRASVALTIRIRPSYTHWPSANAKAETLEDFFVQEWVQHGEPEILFIKRASRKGDRWTSHIALPGGGLDPTDKDDQAAAIRECSEEVGLDLNEYAIPCGNLPQRLVTTHWGKKPLLVLCPYIFLLTTHTIPPLRLQPTEVAATHWVPVRRLQAPEARTVAFEDVSSRLANQETGLKKWMYKAILGKMMFAGISLLPTESLHSTAHNSSLDLQDNRLAQPTTLTRLQNLWLRIYRSDLFGSYPPLPPEGPLLLWGLTLGVMSDFLDLIPPHNALTLWTYPTFTPLDVRLVVWLMTYRFKARKRAELQAGMEPPGPPGLAVGNPTFGHASESIGARYGAQDFPARLTESDVLSASTVVVDKERADETGFHGLGTGVTSEGRSMKKPAVSTMLEGWVERIVPYLLPEVTNRARYYDIVRRAVAVALVGRATFATLVAVWVYKKWVRSRR